MLPDRTLQLLTAYVDGELSTRQRKTALRLLRKSAEARALFKQLQTDSHTVRELTRLKLGPDFPLKVLRTIAQAGIRPVAPSRLPAPGMSPWAAIAVAASVLVLTFAGSYWYFAPQQAVRLEGPFVVTPQVEALPLDPLAGKVFEGTFAQFGQKGLRFAPQDLMSEGTRARLATELRQDNAFHVDLAVRDSGQAVHRLETVLKNTGIQVVMALSTRAGLKQKQPQASYVFYAENVRPEELADILGQLGGNARHTMPTGPTDAAVEQVIVDSMTPEHRVQLANLLGVPANKLQPASMGPSDPPLDLLNKKLIEAKRAGQGGTPPMPSQPAPPREERLAVVLATNQGAAANPVVSDEVQRFVRGRRAQRPGTLQVLLVVHEASV